jgi:hypothetical protein
MTPERCREAWSLLGWSQDRLAVAIRVFEKDGHVTSPKDRSRTALAAVRAALEAAGIKFVDEVPGVPIVRLRNAEV